MNNNQKSIRENPINAYLKNNSKTIINNITTNNLSSKDFTIINNFIKQVFNNHYYVFKTDFTNDEILSTGWLATMKTINKINKLNLNIDFDIYLYVSLRREFAKFIYEEKHKTTQYFKYANNSLLTSIADFCIDYYKQYNEYPKDKIIIDKFKLNKDINKFILNEVERLIFIRNIREESIDQIEFNDKSKLLEEINSKIHSKNMEDIIFVKEIATLIYKLADTYLDPRNKQIYIRKLPIDENGNLKDVKTLKEISKEFGLSKERIRQIIKTADKKVKCRVQKIIKNTI